MKTGLKLSIAVDLLLLVAAGYLAMNIGNLLSQSKPETGVEATADSQLRLSRIAVQSENPLTPFRWSQLELSASPPPEESRNAPATEPEIFSMPLVFKTPEETELGLDEGQRQGLEELREEFIAAVGGLNQRPDDPAYAERWQAAQPKFDGLVPGTIGRGAFLRMQLDAEPGPTD